MSMETIKRKRNGLNLVNCFFFSALGCILPFLSTHQREIGITKIQSAWITSIAALVSMAGPLCLGPIAYKYNKYKTLLIFLLMVSFICYTGLLFIPKVLRTERQPKIFFDCTSSILRIEQCPNWGGQCHTHPKRPATNFSNFQLTTCTYECPYTGTLNASWYPLHVCFRGSSDEGNLCLVHHHHTDRVIDEPRASKRTDNSHNGSDEGNDSTVIDVIARNAVQFDSRFDRWPVIESHEDDIVYRVFNGLPTCTYQPAPPLIVDQKLYDNVNCRPFVHNCYVYCNVNLRHRRKSSNEKDIILRPPVPCIIEIGDPQKTFYLYLALRSLADLSLFTAYTLLDALGIALTNNFDSFYGGFSKLWSVFLPLIIWSPVCGQLVDYFSSIGSPNYAPPFIIFDGFIIIAAFLVLMMPLSPINLMSKSVSQTIGKSASFVATKQMYPRQHTKRSATIRLVFLLPLILLLGSQWGLLETFLHPFYIDMGSSKLSIGLTFTATFMAAAPFAFIAKSLINGVGRVHLIVLAFIFYALRFGGISYLLHPKWLIVPFEMMEAFTLPIAWIGVTSYCHHLIKRSPNAATYVSSAIFQKYSPHIILQYTLNLIHFGGGRALGAVIGGVWLMSWPEYSDSLFWLIDLDIDYADEFIDSDDGFRILLRLLAIISVTFGLIFALFYNCCCVGIRFKKRSKLKHQTQSNNDSPPVVLNGTYSRLMEMPKTESAVINLQESQLNTHSTEQRPNRNGEPRIRMADEDVDDDNQTLLTQKYS